MKHVLSIATLYPNSHTPRFGTFVARSLEALAKRGDWKVTVINPIGVPPLALGRYRPLRQAATDGFENGISVNRPIFTLIPKFGARHNPAAIARSIMPLAKQLHAQEPFDIIDGEFFYPEGPAAARLAEVLDLPFSIKARGSDITLWGKQNFAREQMLHAARQADGLLSVSAALKRDMVALGMPADKITLHYTGLDRDRFRPLDHVGLKAKVSQQLSFACPENEPLLVTVGGLVPHKGQDLVMGALAGLPRARLILVGTGPEEAHLRGLARDLQIEERVHFTGAIDHNLLPVILSAADAMVLPSEREGLANAWVEALACGTPVVISDVGGARELVTSDVAGALVARNVDAVKAGIERVLAQPRSRTDVAEYAAPFNWEVHAQNLADYFSRLIANR